MKRLDPRFIEGFSMQATRLMRAIRHIQTLENHLPEGFPEPSEIELTKRPYDLEMVWHAKSSGHVITLSKRLADELDFDEKWHENDDNFTPSLLCRAKVSVGGKSTMNLIMRITGPQSTEHVAGQ